MVDAGRREVHTQYETIPYDALVLAAGTTNNFFSNPDLVKHVFTIKSTPEAIRCRNEMLDRLERASICTDVAQGARLPTLGNGPEVVGRCCQRSRGAVRGSAVGKDNEKL